MLLFCVVHIHTHVSSCRVRTYIQQKKKDAGMTGQGLAAAIEYATTTLAEGPDGFVEIGAMADMALDMDKAATKRDNIKIKSLLEKNQEGMACRIDSLEKKMDRILAKLGA